MNKKFIIFVVLILIFSLIQFASDKKKQSSSKVKPVKLNTKNVSAVKDIIKFIKPMQGTIIHNPTVNGNVITLYRITSGPAPFNIYLYNEAKTTLIKKLYSYAMYKRYESGIINALKSVKSGMYTLKATNANNEQIIGFSGVFTYRNNNQVTIKKKPVIVIKKN